MWECNEAQHQLLTGFKKPYDLVRRETLYILSESQIPTKLNRQIKIFSIKTYSKVGTGKYLVHFLFRMLWNNDTLLSPLLFNSAFEYSIRKVE